MHALVLLVSAASITSQRLLHHNRARHNRLGAHLDEAQGASKSSSFAMCAPKDEVTPSDLATAVIANVFEGEFGSRGEVWVFGQAVLLGGVLAAPDLPGLSVLSRVIGLAVMLGGLAIAVVAAADLGTSLSPWPKPTDANTLQVDGVYSVCRHPIYTGLVCGCGGLGLLTASTERLLLSYCLYVLLSSKAAREEAFMEEKHGAAYIERASKVPRFFPRAESLASVLKDAEV